MMTAYPLTWPAGWPRTKRPQRSRFSVTLDVARQELVWEIERMGGRYPLISTDVPLRRDGYPYASAKTPDDVGVAVYFERDGKQMVFACDRWDRIRDNLRAIQKTIEALRGVERWGASDMMERALSAFVALPSPIDPWGKLDIQKGSGDDEIERAYRSKAKTAHPDAGGTAEEMVSLSAARDEALSQCAKEASNGRH